MKTKSAMERAGGRDALAHLLGVETITTYHWRHVLPAKHERYLRAARPDWFGDSFRPVEVVKDTPVARSA